MLPKGGTPFNLLTRPQRKLPKTKTRIKFLVLPKWTLKKVLRMKTWRSEAPNVKLRHPRIKTTLLRSSKPPNLHLDDKNKPKKRTPRLGQMTCQFGTSVVAGTAAVYRALFRNNKSKHDIVARIDKLALSLRSKCTVQLEQNNSWHSAWYRDAESTEITEDADRCEFFHFGIRKTTKMAGFIRLLGSRPGSWEQYRGLQVCSWAVGFLTAFRSCETYEQGTNSLIPEKGAFHYHGPRCFNPEILEKLPKTRQRTRYFLFRRREKEGQWNRWLRWLRRLVASSDRIRLVETTWITWYRKFAWSYFEFS